MAIVVIISIHGSALIWYLMIILAIQNGVSVKKIRLSLFNCTECASRSAMCYFTYILPLVATLANTLSYQALRGLSYLPILVVGKYGYQRLP